MKQPLVSILMPMYNASQSVGDTIRTLRSQTYENWELLIIDDGSQDESADVVAAIQDDRIRLTRGLENLGLPSRLNQCVAQARGAFLARMDADDLAFPRRLEVQVDFLLENPLVDVVATEMLVVDAEGSPSGRQKWRGAAHHDITASPWSGFHFNHATWMGRAGWFRRHRYRADAFRTEDDDLILRSYRNSRFHRMNVVLYAYRVAGVTARAAWTARRHFMKSLWREGLRQGDFRLLMGIPIQLSKTIAERTAEVLGIAHAVQGHRGGQPVAPDVLEEYEELRRTLS